MGMPYDLIWLCVPGYIAIQAFLMIRSRERPSAAVWAPLIPMAVVFALTAINLANGSNLWPLPLLLASPVACLYLAVIGLTSRDRPEPTAASR